MNKRIGYIVIGRYRFLTCWREALVVVYGACLLCDFK